jgi:hypothetical protein
MSTSPIDIGLRTDNYSQVSTNSQNSDENKVVKTAFKSIKDFFNKKTTIYNIKYSATTALTVASIIALTLFFATPPGWFVLGGLLGGVVGALTAKLILLSIVFVISFTIKSLTIYNQQKIIGKYIPPFIFTKQEEKPLITRVFKDSFLNIVTTAALVLTYPLSLTGKSVFTKLTYALSLINMESYLFYNKSNKNYLDILKFVFSKEELQIKQVNEFQCRTSSSADFSSNPESQRSSISNRDSLTDSDSG